MGLVWAPPQEAHTSCLHLAQLGLSLTHTAGKGRWGRAPVLQGPKEARKHTCSVSPETGEGARGWGEGESLSRNFYLLTL